MKKLVLILLVCFSFQTIQAQKNVALYWDASYSMKDRNVEREFNFLDNYFKKNSEANVSLTMFSNDIILEQLFPVTNGDWSALRRELGSTIYDGGTSYSLLFKKPADEYLLFTDGMMNMDKLKAPTDKPIHIVSSVDETNKTDLMLISDLSEGRFVYLTTNLNTVQNERKDEMESGDDDGMVTGLVSGYEGSLANVAVVNQTSGEGSATDTRGNYEIKAEEGDVLIFSYLGKKTVSVRVNRADIINITMVDVKENLDEVVLTAEAEVEEVVNTGNTTVDKKRLGYSVEQITSDDITEQDITVQQAVQGQFTNFTLPNDTAIDNFDLTQFLGRGRNMTILLNQFGLVVVDGVPQETSDSAFGGFKSRQLGTLNPDIIASITYLKGLAATNKYGTLGRNGVLLITTKMAQVSESTGQVEDKPLGTTMTYTGSAQDIAALSDAPYMKSLTSSNSIDDAFSAYLNEREANGDSPSFYFDAFDYFEGWNNPLISKRVLSNVYEIANDDAKMLKVLAYKQQASGYYKDAENTYKRIVKLESKKSQSYRNLALANSYAGNYQDALDLYNRMESNSNVGGSDFTGLYKTVFNETRNLISQHGNDINTQGTDDKFLRPTKYKVRIVFEWNDLDAEFDVNIINPQNRYFTWSHTQAENSQNILTEHQQGYGLEEFYLTDSDRGEWKFNVTYYGKTSSDKNPTYLKITTYKNFGYPTQTKSIKVVKLDKKNIEQTVSSVLVN